MDENAKLALITGALWAVCGKAQRQHSRLGHKQWQIEVGDGIVEFEVRNTTKMVDGEFRAVYDVASDSVRFFFGDL